MSRKEMCLMPEIFFFTIDLFSQLMNQHGQPYGICQNSISHSLGVHHTEFSIQYELHIANKTITPETTAFRRIHNIVSSYSLSNFSKHAVINLWSKTAYLHYHPPVTFAYTIPTKHDIINSDKNFLKSLIKT